MGKLACPWDLEGAETVSTSARGSAWPCVYPGRVCPGWLCGLDHSVCRSTRSWVLVGVLGLLTLRDGAGPRRRQGWIVLGLSPGWSAVCCGHSTEPP